MTIHPLFDGFTHSQREDAADALGFDWRRIAKPGADASEEGKRDGFMSIGGFRLREGVEYLEFVRPRTSLAMALYLLGVGHVEHEAYRARAEQYSYAVEGDLAFQGEHKTREIAEYVGRQAAIRQRKPSFKTMAVLDLMASSVYSGASVLEDLRVSAYSSFGEASNDWPCLKPDQTGVFCDAFALLVDGFARHTGSTPLFTIPGKVVEHRTDPAFGTV